MTESWCEHDWHLIVLEGAGVGFVCRSCGEWLEYHDAKARGIVRCDWCGDGVDPRDRDARFESHCWCEAAREAT